MIAVTTFAGKSVALFGLGGSGLITAAALVAGGADVTCWDDNPASVVKAQGQGLSVANLREVDFTDFDALVLAPGVPLTHPMPHWTVDLAHAAGVEIIGDIDLFSREMAAAGRISPLIAITGTNGKSTTTALIAHVLRQADRDVQMGGNIGRAVLDLDPIRSGGDQVYVVECSSYQIDLAPNLTPHVGVLLNITPDHLERHGTIENYAAIKEQLVARSDLAIVGCDDAYCLAVGERLGAANVPLVTISAQEESHAEIQFADGVLRNSQGERLASLASNGALRGAHNGQNAACAFAACEAVGLSAEEIQHGFDTFPGLEHRMEQVGRVGDTLFINDSKATNAEAAAPALKSFEQVRWIVGGLAKTGGIESLAPHFSRVSKAYLVGEAAPAFAAQLGDTIPYEISGTLKEAVNHAAADSAQAGGEQIVLLSPAAASFDQFPNFEKRGEAFKEAVRALQGFKSV
ncbi:UDP-N-acetylmuramoyl-L-alanine--D-glutamate ligase [Pseudahrensia aquimaris]|uniref:UDP-N-acetylmuramoylalanine--D-glutamate ligase n=1 Tax=Pseudahrensia aquimaris TaxID=744461 RepID=A0ABW3FHH6_9HYPH